MTSYMSKDQGNIGFSVHDPFKGLSANVMSRICLFMKTFIVGVATVLMAGQWKRCTQSAAVHCESVPALSWLLEYKELGKSCLCRACALCFSQSAFAAVFERSAAPHTPQQPCPCVPGGSKGIPLPWKQSWRGGGNSIMLVSV